jgi:hypothetical protein
MLFAFGDEFASEKRFSCFISDWIAVLPNEKELSGSKLNVFATTPSGGLSRTVRVERRAASRRVRSRKRDWASFTLSVARIMSLTPAVFHLKTACAARCHTQ